MTVFLRHTQNNTLLNQALKKGCQHDSLYFEATAPPSVNRMFSIVRGRRIKSKVYRAWQNANALWWSVRMRERGWQTITEPCRVDIRACVGRQRDIDNMVKIILDTAERAGAVRNDNLVDEIRILRVAGGTGMGLNTIEVSISKCLCID